MAATLDSLPLKWEEYKTKIEKIKKESNYRSDEEVIAFARTFCYSVIRSLWRLTDKEKKWNCRKVKFVTVELDFLASMLAKEIADYFMTLNIMEYTYLLGNLYTMLLPEAYRSSNGIYYTPPELAERLLDLLAAEGADWSNAKILDPACGGGAFLVTVANRILGDYRIKELPAELKLRHLECHLAGIELDEFAASLTQCLLDILVYPESLATGRRLKSMIKIQDTIQFALGENQGYDVIVGNPPYGRLKLDNKTRENYERSLYGHANLYGLFMDASIRLRKENGLIGFVTPTSFLGGKYFSNLRSVLIREAPPLAIDFVDMRNGVFDKVLQETCLVVLGTNSNKTITANKLSVGADVYQVERIGSFNLEEGTGPWIIAREPADTKLVNQIRHSKVTLSDYGYKVATGQLVWNRLKSQISETPGQGYKPIIWAEAINHDGVFNFEYKYRDKMKYILPTEAQNFLVCDKTAILVQRTTSKEEERRLRTCILPQEFIDQWEGVVVENHVNIIQPLSKEPKVSLKTLLLILNSKTADRIFRCLSGSVAVSATELYALPLPPIGNLSGLETFAAFADKNAEKVSTEKIEKMILNAYAMEE